MSQKLAHVLAALGVVLAAALVSAGTGLGVDYAGPCWVGVDAASPSIEALVAGNFHAFFAQQPMMGGFSLFARAPFAAFSGLDHHHELLSEYRLGAFPCVLSLGVLGLVVDRMMERDGRPWTARVLAIGLVMAGPSTFKTLLWGHPEELLATALAVGGLLAARRRPLLAGLLLGLAVATKQWALLAVVPALAVATEQRVKLLAVAAGAAAAFILPMAIGDFHRFMAQTHMAGAAGPGVTPSSVWWPFGHISGSQVESGEVIKSYAIPHWMGSLAEPLVMAIALALSVAYWRQRAEHDPADALGLFAAIMLIRCMLDPMAISYHNGAFFVALATFEARRSRGLPYLTLAAGAGLLLTSHLAPHPDLLNAVYLAWSVPLAAFLALSVLGSGRLGGRLRARPAVATA